MSEQKLMFNIIYYPAFQNVRNIMEELNILVTPNKELKKVFLMCLLQDFLVRVTLFKLDETGRRGM